MKHVKHNKDAPKHTTGRQKSGGRATRFKSPKVPKANRFFDAQKPNRTKCETPQGGQKVLGKGKKVPAKPQPLKPVQIHHVQHVAVRADEKGMRLDRWFCAHFTGLPFSHLQKLIRTGQVRVDKKRAKAHMRLATGQIVRVPPLMLTVEAPKNNNINTKDARFIRDLIVFENDHFMVLNKPAGLAVQGGSKTDRHIDAMLRAVPNETGDIPRLVHRLDKDTSGLLVVARTLAAARQLTELFRTRKVIKIYWALTAGVPHPRQGKINLALEKTGAPDAQNMHPCDQHAVNGKRAVTFYKVNDHAGGKFGFVALKPVTGRTHQLRVHMAAIGTPIFNDARYFNIENFAAPNGLGEGLHLHARFLRFQDPVSGHWLNLTATLNPQMAHSFAQLGFDEMADDTDLIEVA